MYKAIILDPNSEDAFHVKGILTLSKTLYHAIPEYENS
jgi:hypothetical protein